MKRIILISAALFLHAVCFAADFRVISDTKVYDGDYHYIGELKKGDIVQLFDCSATTDEELDFAFTLLLNMNGKMRLVDLSTVIPNETSELFDERVRHTTLTAQGKNWIPVQNIDILRSRSRDRYYETYKNKLARYDEPDIFQISWHEHYTVRTAAQIENCFLYFTDEKNYAIFLYVKDIKTTGNGYMVSCEMFKSHTSDLFVEKNDFLENLTEKGQIVNLLLIFDGDYLHIYTEKNQRLFTYALMDSEYSAQMENLIRNETCDLSKVTWPRHADGTCDYEEANGNATAVSGNANKEESADALITERAESEEESAIQKPAPAVGKTAAVTENLRLRTDNRTTAEVIATLAAGTRVKILAVGRGDAIDGIASNWVRVAVLGGATDRDGKAVAAGTEGWLFGGYLSAAEDAESGSPGGEAAAAKAPALPVALVAAGGAVLAVLLAAIILATKKRKGGKGRNEGIPQNALQITGGTNMADINKIYKTIGDELYNSLKSDWDKIELNIECSDSHIGMNARYLTNGEWKDNLDYDLATDTMLSIIDFHKDSEKNNLAPWNRAVYTLEKNGHFDMTFEWDQALQDEWDKA